MCAGARVALLSMIGHEATESQTERLVLSVGWTVRDCIDAGEPRRSAAWIRHRCGCDLFACAIACREVHMRTQASEKRLRAVCRGVCCGLVALLWTEMLLKRVKTSLCGREASRGGVAPRAPGSALSAVPDCLYPPPK